MAASRRWLPREGFTADVVTDLIKKTAFAPSVTLPLLFLARYTSKGQNIAHDRPGAFRALKALVALGLARWVNKWFNRRALNNWTSDKYVWNKEIAIVTGGSEGIGQRIATGLAIRGVKVAVLDIQPLKYRAHPNIKFFQCDVCSTEEIAEVAGQVREKLGHPTILVNNAGILKGKTVLSVSESDIRTTFEINTMAHYWLAREFLPEMVNQNHGMIVTVASQAAFCSTPTMVEYCASKAAALSFHEGIGAELRTRYNAPKVRTVAVTQGFSRTKLTDVLAPEDSWFNPYLHADTVAELVVQQIMTGESGHIMIPRTSGVLVGHFRSFPYWMQRGFLVRLNRLMKRPTVKWG